MNKLIPIIPVAIGLTAVGASAASLSLGARTQVSSNNANFDISVFDGNAKYNDRGMGGSEPGAPTFQTPLGNGTVLSYNFVGNEGTGSALTTYASGGSRIPTPTAPAANVHGNGEEWANVWTSNDPGSAMDFSGSVKNHNPGVAGAANTFARAANVDGTIDITGLDSGQIYVPHGTFINQWSVTLTMSGAGQTDITAADFADVNGPGTNMGWISDFSFDNTGGLYDTISYNYTNADSDGSRARFMGVILTPTAVPEPSSSALLGLAGLGLLRRRR